MIRCITYISKANSVCSDDEIERLVNQAQVKNAARGISGRLFYIDARFIQVLEGGEASVGSLFESIKGDPRHRQVVTLLDRPIEQRAFRDWSMQFVAGDDLTEGDLGGLRTALDGLERVDIWALATSRSLGDLAAGPADGLISTAFRVAPRQSRSIGTVERLLAAGEGIVKRTRRLDTINLEAVADEAGVTPQAAYRYFADVDDLILLGMRRVLAVEHERLLAFLTAHVFETEAQLANAAVAFITQAYQEMARIPAAMRDRVARDYHEISYDLLWTVGETIHLAMTRRGDPCAGIGAMQLTAGLTAVVAVAKSLFLRDIALLNEPSAQLMMVGVFLGAVRGGRTDGGGGRREDGRIGTKARKAILPPGAPPVARMGRPHKPLSPRPAKSLLCGARSHGLRFRDTHLQARDGAAARTDFFNISALEFGTSYLASSLSRAKPSHGLAEFRQEGKMPKLNSLEKVAALLIAGMSLIPLAPYALGQ